MNIEAIVIAVLLLLAAAYVGYFVVSRFRKKGCGSSCYGCPTPKPNLKKVRG